MELGNVTTRPQADYTPRTGGDPAGANATNRAASPVEGGDIAALQARLESGGRLTPVESGTLARLLDRQPDGGGGGAQQVGPTPSPTPGPSATATKKTADDFTIVGGTAQDKKDLQQALDYLQQTGADGKPVSPTAAKLIQDLPKGATINIIHNGNDAYHPDTGVIDWDPRSGLQVTSGQGTQSAALGLVHEVDHKLHGQANPQPTGDGYQNTEEKRVITGSETQIAHDLHEPTRTDHYGTTTVEKSSISHTNVGGPLPAPPSSSPTPSPSPGPSPTPPSSQPPSSSPPSKPEEPSIWQKIVDFFKHLF